MKAVALTPNTTAVRLVDREEPPVTMEDQVKVQVLRVGVCGTDREEAAGGRALAPDGESELVLGHEMLGKVVAVGKAVTRVRVGDYAVFAVRRGCGECLPCGMHRSDMCQTGRYKERGIWGLDGYQAEYVVDQEQYAVCLPPELSEIGVLVEPLSIVEKAIEEAVRLQLTRLPGAPAKLDWLSGRRCLVAGLGPVGLLAALVLRLRGATVYGLDIVDPESIRPRWLREIGGEYVDGRRVPANQVEKTLGPMDLIFEAAGIAGLAFNLLDALAVNGIYALTGIPGGDCLLQIQGAQLIRQLVLDNQVMMGSVNAAHDHLQMAVEDLTRARVRWGDHIQKLITHRYPYAGFEKVLRQHPPDEIKAVIEWGTE